MSDPTRLSTSAVSVVDRGVAIASLALYCYEWMLTFDREVERIWRPKWTISTCVFVVTRYAGLLDVILQQLPAANFTACVFEIRLTHTLVLLQYFMSALFTGLRTYALCHRNFWVFCIVFALGIAPVVANMITFVGVKAFFMSGTCQSIRPFSNSQELSSSLAARITVIVADVIALVVTWTHTISHVRSASSFRFSTPLCKALVRDGTFLFLGLLAINILQLASDNLPNSPNLVGQFGCAVSPTYPSILLCRFILNLREAANESIDDSALTAPRSSMHFRSNILLGNLGEPLEFGGETDEQESKDSIELSERSVYHLETFYEQTAVDGRVVVE